MLNRNIKAQANVDGEISPTGCFGLGRVNDAFNIGLAEGGSGQAQSFFAARLLFVSASYFSRSSLSLSFAASWAVI
jgi:hypothetical protein